MAELLPPGSTIGILGGGQLGRMLAMAAAKLGYHTHIFAPEANAPAAQVASAHTQAAYEDHAALEAFASTVDVVTYEFENIPLETARKLGTLVPVRPGTKALEVSQDRLAEKTFLQNLGLATAPFADVVGADGLAVGLETIGTPSILKTRRFGYDGKGQFVFTPTDPAPDLGRVLDQPCILEGFVDFSCEVSVIAARGLSGDVVAYDPGENVHEAGILSTTSLPARIPSRLATDAVLLAGKILNALDYVGVLGVELFVTPQTLVVNEIAPRVHNSGHWTEAACAVSQFEQHIRAITGLPLGDGSRHSDAIMENLIGSDVERWRDGSPGLHLYGKGEARAGRKMGHITRLTPKS
ncbi:MAG: 5-(carboxyamino)imidazole ribonucleotide synthase [Pseudomonadota bacterium]